MGSFILDSITRKHKKIAKMKLLAASAAVLASTYSAQTIETLIGELINKVYQHDPVANTYTINVSPYWNAVYTCEGNGFSGKGTYGNGNGVIEFSEQASWTETSFDFKVNQKGQMKSHPWSQIMSFPNELLNDNFDDSMTVAVGSEGISLSGSGNINGQQVEQSMSLNIDEVSMMRSKIEAKISFNRKTDYPSSLHQFYKDWIMWEAGSSNVNVAASAKKICSENPFDQSCTAKVTVTGNHNNKDLGNSVAKYSVQKKKAQFQVKHNNNEVFWMGLLGIDNFQVISLKYKLNGGKAVLVAQVVGPAGFAAVQNAAGVFFAPYANFFNNIQDGDDAAHIVAYFDKVAATWNNKLFNVYPIIKATQFESDLLKDYALNGVKVQKFAENMSNAVADTIVGFSQQTGAAVSDGRVYLNNLTGPVGESKFDAWFAKL